jgi:hypothetical protein
MVGQRKAISGERRTQRFRGGGESARQTKPTAVRNGIIPPTATVEVVPQRTTLAAALNGYKEYVQYHRTLRTFRTYRPILESFKAFCNKNYV